MTQLTFLAGIAVGCVAALGVIVKRTLFDKEVVTLSEGVIAFLAGAGIVTGVRVCAIGLQLIAPTAGDAPYLFLGGLAVVWVSVETIVRTLASVRRQE